MFTRQSLMDFGLEKEAYCPHKKWGIKLSIKGIPPTGVKKDIQ